MVSLVFDLPDIPQQGGHHVRVFKNKSINNNTDNFDNGKYLNFKLIFFCIKSRY